MNYDLLDNPVTHRRSAEGGGGRHFQMFRPKDKDKSHGFWKFTQDFFMFRYRWIS